MTGLKKTDKEEFFKCATSRARGNRSNEEHKDAGDNPEYFPFVSRLVDS